MGNVSGIVVRLLDKAEKRICRIREGVMRGRLTKAERIFLAYVVCCKGPRSQARKNAEWQCALQILDKAKGRIDKISCPLEVDLKSLLIDGKKEC